MVTAEIARFASFLAPEESELYNAALTTEAQIAYELALDSVQRWKNSAFPHFHPEKTESNFEHVRDCLNLQGKLIKKFPVFSEAINQTEVKFMIIGHDGGEIITDDYSISSQDRDTPLARRRKKQEHAILTRLLIRPYVNSGYMEQTEILFQRYFANDPRDVEVQFGHLIDRLQGSIFGAEHVFPYQGEAEPERTRHVATTLNRIMDPAEHLFRHGNPNMHTALTAIVHQMADLFEKIGFPVQAETALQSWKERCTQALLDDKINI